jgi:hypothetical protein
MIVTDCSAPTRTQKGIYSQFKTQNSITQLVVMIGRNMIVSAILWVISVNRIGEKDCCYLGVYCTRFELWQV